MSEENPAPPQNVVVARPQRLVVQSPVAIMDTARFEHLGRVATVMAKAQILPDTITANMDFDTVQARAFLIAGWADRMNMDPVMVGQGCSFVHGRIMFEGKVVDAAIQGTLGYEFEGDYGAWDAKANIFIEGPPGEGKTLAIRITAVDENGVTICDSKGRPKAVEGYVGGWETTKAGSPWSSPASWRRMLRNRGVREWARFYRSGVILGTYTPEDRWESDEVIESAPRSRKLDLSAKLAGNQDGGDGFNREGIEATINGAAEHDVDGVVSDAEVEEPTTPQPPKARDEINGPAPAGVIYMLAGDPVSDAGRVPTYKDGEKHSTVGAKGAADLARYTMHPSAPLAEPETDGKFPGDKPAPRVATNEEAEALLACNTEVTEEIAAEWVPLERNDGHAPRGVEYTLRDDLVEPDDTIQAYEDGEPSRRVPLRDFVTLPEYEAHPESLIEDAPEGTIYDALMQETTWEAIKKALPGIYNQMTTSGVSWDDQEQVRRQIWGTVILGHLRDRHNIEVKPTLDPSLFHIFRATQAGPEGAAVLRDVFAQLEKAPLFLAMPKEAQEKIRGITEATCAAISD